MKRNLTALSDSTFDVAIVGAGIYGAAIAWDASLRGLSVALIDKGDFCGATSANSLKTIHGGLRYLQNLDVKRMRESIREGMDTPVDELEDVSVHCAASGASPDVRDADLRTRHERDRGALRRPPSQRCDQL